MIDVEMWDVCIADVPYEDLPESKVRPILIVERGAFVIECLKLTGQPPRAGEYVLKMWREAGLHKPTTVRIGKKLKLEINRVRKRVGRLDPVDMIGIGKLIEPGP